MSPQPTFPFTAIVGQADLKLGLILNAVNPRIGGLLVRGEKGTAKSTIVRGLAAILPPMETYKGCAFHCRPGGAYLCPACQSGSKVPVRRARPVITLPLNATEDRVAGGMDFDRAVREGKKILLPGLLASAHRSILYVDEINLLDDHIVDIILDAAASGENRVEREGLSFAHPANFILVGTMNPEEGDLRPQLLDRFGLCVEVAGEKDPDLRMELMVIRESFDRDPEGFIAARDQEIQALSVAVAKAKKLLPRVRMPAHLRGFIAELAATHHVAGHRADLVIEQAALAHAAYMGTTEVSVADISRVAPFALVHRRQEASPPPPEPPEPDPPDQDPDDEASEDPADPPEDENSGKTRTWLTLTRPRAPRPPGRGMRTGRRTRPRIRTQKRIRTQQRIRSGTRMQMTRAGPWPMPKKRSLRSGPPLRLKRSPHPRTGKCAGDRAGAPGPGSPETGPVCQGRDERRLPRYCL